ncbi:MAG: hypothetical protein LLF92_00440 [Planctomycetaceae bacterium]|nr:hypothetical protein [Planctomycetaceae bacterium]
MTLHKPVLTMLVVCIAVQGFSVAKPTDVSKQKCDSCLLPSICSETTTLFLSLQKRPKTDGSFSAKDGYYPVNTGGYSFCNIFRRNTCKSGDHLDSLRLSAISNSLQSLFCQFII